MRSRFPRRSGSRLRAAACLVAAAHAIAAGQAVEPNLSSPLRSRKVLVLEGGSISGDHLAARTVTWTNLQAMSAKVGFTLAKSDAKALTDAKLAQYDILVFNYFFETETEEHFPAASKRAFQDWLAKGRKGYVGYHTSGANEYALSEWLWYQDNVTSMRYVMHGSGTPLGTVEKTADASVASHPIMQGLPQRFSAEDEWYGYERSSALYDPSKRVKIMYNLTNAAAIGRLPSPDHPVAWFREDSATGSRYFYATFVHKAADADSDWFKGILVRALEYTAGDPATPVLMMNGDSAFADRGFAYASKRRSLEVVVDGGHTLSIFDPGGRLVYRRSGEGPRSHRPEAFARAGLYVAKLESRAGVFSRPVLVY